MRALIRARRRGACCSGRAEDRLHCDLDGAKLADARLLVVRARRPGDWFMPVGMNGRKKVQDLLVDAHIPREERDRVPILTAGDDVVWIVGLRPDRRYVADRWSHDVYCLAVQADSTDVDAAEERSIRREPCAI